MRRATLLTLLLALLLTFPTVAQDAAPCDGDTITTLLATISDHTTAAADMEPVDALAELALAADAIAVTQASCNGLAFSGGGQAALVLDPFEVPEGLYRMILNGGRNFSVETEVISGDCDVDGFVYVPDAPGEVETLLQSEGCTLLIQLDNATDDWTITFAKIGGT